MFFSYRDFTSGPDKVLEKIKFGRAHHRVIYFVGKKEKITINNKEYSADHFKLKSKNEDLSNDKKLDFDIWYDPKNNIIIKVAYTKMGKWEYKLKNFE